MILRVILVVGTALPARSFSGHNDDVKLLRYCDKFGEDMEG